MAPKRRMGRGTRGISGRKVRTYHAMPTNMGNGIGRTGPRRKTSRQYSGTVARETAQAIFYPKHLASTTRPVGTGGQGPPTISSVRTETSRPPAERKARAKKRVAPGRRAAVGARGRGRAASRRAAAPRKRASAKRNATNRQRTTKRKQGSNWNAAHQRELKRQWSRGG